VSRLTWVVKDVDAVTRGWEKLGMRDIRRHGEIELRGEYRGAPERARARWTSAWMGSVAIDFLQPVEGTNAYTEFLRQHGDGIFGILFSASSKTVVEKEVERMRALGVAVLQQTGFGGRQSTYFDTVKLGKYAIGLIDGPPSPPNPDSRIPLSQIAFVVRNVPAVSDYWRRLGFPAFATIAPLLRDLQYHGKALHYSQLLGFQQFGVIQFEWCTVPAGMSIYGEYLRKHGEGIQHLATPVLAVDRAVAQSGLPAIQQGSWGEAGKKGSGRFAYLKSIGGVNLEYNHSVQ
jgi:methylmalonyl-CoA/ethylmalonyl-CoA epimerase